MSRYELDSYDFCSDCGKWLSTDKEYEQRVCNICLNSTHVEYAYPTENARAAWQAMKEKVRRAAIEPEVIEPNTRKLKIK